MTEEKVTHEGCCDHDKLIGLGHKVDEMEKKMSSLEVLKENLIRLTALQEQLTENLKQLADNQKRTEVQYEQLITQRDSQYDLNVTATNNLNNKLDLFISETRHNNQNLTVQNGALSAKFEQVNQDSKKSYEKIKERLNAEIDSRQKEKIEIKKAKIGAAMGVLSAIIASVAAIISALV